jgi:hypothetical protein
MGGRLSTPEAEMTYTPGPYLRDGTTVYALEPIEPPRWHKGERAMVNRFTARVDRGRQCSDPAELEATAALIAAAPDLLAALKGFNLTAENIVSGTADTLILQVPIAVIQQAAAAIAKADPDTPA